MWNNTYGTQYYGGKGLPKGASMPVDTSGLNNFFGKIGDNLKRAIFSPDEVNRERTERLKRLNPAVKPTNKKPKKVNPKLDPLEARRQVLEQAGIIKPGALIPDMETGNVPTYTEEAGYSYDPVEPTESKSPKTPELPPETPAASVSAQDALKGFLAKLDSEYGINYGGSGNVSGVSRAMADTSTGENVSITNGPNAGKTISVNDPDFDDVVSGKKKGGMTEISGVSSKKLADALSDTESLRYNPSEGAYEGAGSASDYVLPGLDKGTRAFLDYNGKGGSLMALRSRDAARNTLRAGGRDYLIDGDKKATLISREGSEFLRENPGADAASQEFITNYMKPKVTPSDTETSDATDPLPGSIGDYMKIASETPMVTPVVSDQGIPAIDRGTNRSLITGAPSEYGDLSMDVGLNSVAEPPVQGFLPDTEYWDSVRKFYIK